MKPEYLTAPVDPASASSLASRQLRLDVVDPTDVAVFGSWLQSLSRGFYDEVVEQKVLDERLVGLAGRRSSGVWDDTGADPASPVATVSSWPAALSVPGERSITAWAISAVTVAPTHRRRGIARDLLEAELRTARDLGLPLAVLTVSEATIYGRFGFAPAAFSTDLKIDTGRATWAGSAASGRLHLVSTEQLREQAAAMLEGARAGMPGEMEMSAYLLERLLGLGVGAGEPKSLRAVRYDDAEGVPKGFAVYRVVEIPGDTYTNRAELKYLFAATSDAYAGLWRYILELDLVSVVTAPGRPVDEPLGWMVSDYRAISHTGVRDHLWLRILDVKAALEGRRYAAAGRIVLQIADPLGFAEGRFLLDIDARGEATVSPLEGPAPDGAAVASLAVAELGAIYLGGVSARTLLRAGRITELMPAAADAIDDSFRSSAAPWLSFWF